MKMALEKIAFLPFGMMIDEWRWDVFAGAGHAGELQQGLVGPAPKYQGIAPPVARTEADFDPGAKYHIPGNTPYTRYFLSLILQFQFQKALCDAAGFKGPLHGVLDLRQRSRPARSSARCSRKARASRGRTRCTKLTGTRQMDASAILDYFAPLQGWLKQQNEGKTCGW